MGVSDGNGVSGSVAVVEEMLDRSSEKGEECVVVRIDGEGYFDWIDLAAEKQVAVGDQVTLRVSNGQWPRIYDLEKLPRDDAESERAKRKGQTWASGVCPRQGGKGGMQPKVRVIDVPEGARATYCSPARGLTHLHFCLLLEYCSIKRFLPILLLASASCSASEPRISSDSTVLERSNLCLPAHTPITSASMSRTLPSLSSRRTYPCFPSWTSGVLTPA